MKPALLITALLYIFSVNTSAQIQLESLDLEVPCISVKDNAISSKSGPVMIVKIDSIEYKLDSLSFNKIDAEWIKCVNVYTDYKNIERYGCPEKDGVVIIQLKDDYIDDFLLGKYASNQLRVKKAGYLNH